MLALHMSATDVYWGCKTLSRPKHLIYSFEHETKNIWGLAQALLLWGLGSYQQA